jgi:hypothetical protein
VRWTEGTKQLRLRRQTKLHAFASGPRCDKLLPPKGLTSGGSKQVASPASATAGRSDCGIHFPLFRHCGTAAKEAGQSCRAQREIRSVGSGIPKRQADCRDIAWLARDYGLAVLSAISSRQPSLAASAVASASFPFLATRRPGAASGCCDPAGKLGAYKQGEPPVAVDLLPERPRIEWAARATPTMAGAA